MNGLPGLLSFEVAVERLLALARPLAPERHPIATAANLYLAQDIRARLTRPPADLSAMDGYALRFADLPGPLRLVGESAAGRPLAATIGAGETARIFTGAHLPAGADTVAVQEDAVVDGLLVSFPQSGPPEAGAHIRRRGIDFGEGELLARAGDRLGPARLGLVAAAGIAEVAVHRPPRVGILSTGDELVAPGTLPLSNQIVGSNGLMIAALLQGLGAEVTDFGIVADDRAVLADAIAAARAYDLLVTIGGASVGDHDLVKPVLQALGADIDFWRVAIRPGKPLLAGRLAPQAGATMVVGLPGNPVSAFVCARLFLAPVLRALAGNPAPHDSFSTAQTTTPLAANGARRQFLRATLAVGPAGPKITAALAQDSSLLSVLAGADALLVRPEHAPAAAAGDAVPMLSL